MSSDRSPQCSRVQAAKPFFPPADREEILHELDIMLGTGVLTMGPWVDRIEQSASAALDGAEAVATNSGTSALEMLLRYHGVQGKDVIVPTNSFVASANTVSLAGGNPVLADIEADTLSLSPETIESAMTDATCGVMVVHMAGLVSPRMEQIRALCSSNGLFCIEDAAHAFGARSPDGAAGALADGGAFSLFPTKPVTSGEGGLLVTRESACADFARSYRCHGIDTTTKQHQFVRLGHNFRMSEITALVGDINIRRNPEARRMRDKVAHAYRAFFADGPCRVQSVPDGWVHAWYKFPLTLPPGVDGTAIRMACRASGVACQTTYWPPIHRQPYYASRPECEADRFPVAEDVLRRTIALPIFPELSDQKIEHVCTTVTSAVDDALG